MPLMKKQESGLKCMLLNDKLDIIKFNNFNILLKND